MIGEVGTGAPLMPFEERSLRASVLAMQRTGMGMMVHTDPWAKEGLRVVDVLEDAGADLSRVVIGHLNPTLPDVGYHRAIAERGAVLGYDLCGYDIVQTDGRFPADDWETADAVAQLVARGLRRPHHPLAGHRPQDRLPPLRRLGLRPCLRARRAPAP